MLPVLCAPYWSSSSRRMLASMRWPPKDSLAEAKADLV
jgi:hypothetical protein